MSFFGMSRRSSATDSLKASLYLPVRLQVFQEMLVGHHGFALPLGEGSQVLFILAESLAHSVIDEVRHGPLGMGRLDSRGSMQVWAEVDRGTPW